MRLRPAVLLPLVAALVPLGSAPAWGAKPAPAPGGGVLRFSGHDWAVRSSGGQLQGPGPNVFSSSGQNVWVDGDGRLHLRITRTKGTWTSAEVIGLRSLGHGTYRWTVDSPIGALDPQVVLGLFTWSDDPAFHHREIDVEAARWGSASEPTNAQWVVQPHTTPGNLQRFTIPSTALRSVHEFTWAPGVVSFRSWSGLSSASWEHTGPDVPVPGGETARMNLWLHEGRPPQDGRAAGVVVSRFEHVAP